MNVSNWVTTQTGQPEIMVQGPLDQFEVIPSHQNERVVDTNKLKQTYDGQV